MPPGPRLPGLVQTLIWLVAPIRFLEHCRRRFGPAFTLNLSGWGKHVILGSGEHIEDLNSLPTGAVSAAEANRIMEPVLGSHSLFVQDGQIHQNRRQILQRAFSRRRVEEACGLAQPLLNEFLRDYARTGSTDLRRLVRHLSMSVILASLFGAVRREDVERVARLFDVLLGPASTVLAFSPGIRDLAWPVNIKAWRSNVVKQVHDELASLGRAARKQEHQSLSRDLEAAAADEGWPSGELQEQLVTLVVAGHDTVATALEWMLCWLAAHPTMQADLRHTTSAKIKHVQIEAFCLETLRLYPTVEIVSRTTLRHINIGQYIIPPGVMISPCIYLMHHDPSVFLDPERFDPNRFLGVKYKPTQFAPFGLGHRRCIGANLAGAEMGAVLDKILTDYTVESKAARRPRPRRRHVTIGPKTASFRLSCR